MSHYEESDMPKSNYCGPFRKPRSTKRTYTRTCTIEVNENILIINPGTPNQMVYPRPPLTYAEILKQIICDSNKQLNLSEIYRLLAEKYPYFQHAPMDWKNSIRNCLSTNPKFKNVNEYDSKGFRQRYWILDENAEQQSSTNATTTTTTTSSSSIISNMNWSSSLTLQQSIIDGNDCNVIVPNNLIQNQNTEMNPPISSSSAYFNHRDILLNFDPNLNNLNDAVIYNNYRGTFCIEFYSGNCYPCQLIHNIGRKHMIRCECPQCSNYNPKMLKYNPSFNEGDTNNNSNKSSFIFNHIPNHQQNENVAATTQKSTFISNCDDDLVEIHQNGSSNTNENFSNGGDNIETPF